MLSFFPRDVLDEILDLIESVSEDFPTYSSNVIENFGVVAMVTNSVVAMVTIL